LISLASNFRISSNSAQLLKAFPSLFGGVRKSFTSSVVSVEVAKLGLQYKMKVA
jgi:hypothetical protein